MSVQHVLPSSWLHDDTEEDLVGADWHQHAIRGAVGGLDDLATIHNLPWHVGDQLTLVATKPDGSPWRPSPDIMLHPQAGRGKRAEMSIADGGVPALIIEVASPTTWKYDVDTRRGKAWGYLQLGVPNYLVFDPNADLLGEPCRGWQLSNGVVQPWRPAADGRYYPIGLDISFQPEGDLLRVFGPDGKRLPFGFEKTQQIHAQSNRIVELEAELARLREQAQAQDSRDHGE